MKLISTRIFGAAVLLILIAFSVVALAQTKRVRPSQQGTVSQRVADTEISIEYSRPSAKGRVLFGPKGIVKYSETWMPGANEASNIKFSDDVLVNGKPLESGRYSFWMIPGEKKWTIRIL